MKALAVDLRTDWRGYLLTGPGSTAALQNHALPRPQERQSALEQENVLVARTGIDEYLLFLSGTWPPPDYDWCFTRADRVLEVSGTRWRELLAHVCQYDFRRFEPGSWLMASMAGVNCWLYRRLSDERLLIGVSDGFHHYLEAVLKSLVCELKDSAIHAGETS